MIKNNQLIVFSILALTSLVHSYDQTGFISIDCGLEEASTYLDQITGISYSGDANFTDTGVSKNVAPEYITTALQKQFTNVRSFPEWNKNCYTLEPAKGISKYLIRASFMHGNYDESGNIPVEFDLFIDANLWDTVTITEASDVITKEIVHIPQRSYMHVCLVEKGKGKPFISSLELRPLDNSTYVTEHGSLQLLLRWDIGSKTNMSLRYPDDGYDRIWEPYNIPAWNQLSTQLDVDATGSNLFDPPRAVMNTAIVPANNKSLAIYWTPDNPTSEYYIYAHFAEIQKLQPNQSRELSTYENGDIAFPALVPEYLSTITIYDTSSVQAQGDTMSLSVNKTQNSTLPPILNAIEIYKVVEFPTLLTYQQDVDAATYLKSKYGVKKHWQGDPCTPKAYLWEGVSCNYTEHKPPRMTTLDLSSSGLTGVVPPIIATLTALQSLDLSNNGLNGTVPSFLANLPFLRVLNLKRNNFTGPLPTELIDRANQGSLLLSADDNICQPGSCETTKRIKHKSYVVIIALAIVVPVSVLTIVIAITYICKRQNKKAEKGVPSPTSNVPPNSDIKSKLGVLEPNNRQFTYSDILRITNNLEREIGHGGFGKVYYGHLGNKEVAVKILSRSSFQGYKQFEAEVQLLIRVHHTNLTELVGYCDEGPNKGLIYEFMTNGDLEVHLKGTSSKVLTWEERLRIAVDAGQGLEYLHNGSKPHIIHRDVKTTNILLSESFQAKLSDFGLSRMFTAEGDTHVSTVVAGTPGFLDPEYYIYNRLTEKSDVYSYGIVMLQIITGQAVISKTREKTHIKEWVDSMLENGDIHNIIDPRIKGECDINSVWKAVEITMSCLSLTSMSRPTMSQVLAELKECLAIEIARTKEGHDSESKDSIEMISGSMYTRSTPLPR